MLQPLRTTCADLRIPLCGTSSTEVWLRLFRWAPARPVLHPTFGAPGIDTNGAFGRYERGVPGLTTVPVGAFLEDGSLL